MCCAEEFGDVFGQIKQTFAARKDNIKPIGFGERIIEEKKGGNELQECESIFPKPWSHFLHGVLGEWVSGYYYGVI